MFLAATELCTHCKSTIYPDDESFSNKEGVYHFECAETLELDDEE